MGTDLDEVGMLALADLQYAAPKKEDAPEWNAWIDAPFWQRVPLADGVA